MKANVPRVHAQGILYATPADAISLHLGYPDPLTFPNTSVRAALNAELEENPQIALQYCEEAGDRYLREAIIHSYGVRPDGASATVSEILITQGTTESIALVCQSLVMPGDAVIVERPTYVWGIRTFALFGARVISVRTTHQGISPTALGGTLKRLEKKRIRARLLYVMPDFQNPTGHTMPLDARVELLRIAADYGVTILEDTPYRDIYFHDAPPPTLWELDRAGTVALARSFSKTIGPGIRLGWVMWNAAEIERLAKIKQTGACTLMSRAVARYLSSPSYSTAVESTRELYREKRNAMEAALVSAMPPSVSWSRPAGGFYYWLHLPPRLDAHVVCRAAAQQKVLVLDGSDFFPNRCKTAALRLSFSYESAERIAMGVGRLGGVLRTMCN